MVIDIETTKMAHLHPQTVEAIQIAVVSIGPDEEVKVLFNKHFRPQNGIDAGATAVHGWTKEKLANHDLFSSDHAMELSEILRSGKRVWARNASFDWIVIQREFNKVKCQKLLEGLPKFQCIADLAFEKKVCGPQMTKKESKLSNLLKNCFGIDQFGFKKSGKQASYIRKKTR